MNEDNHIVENKTLSHNDKGLHKLAELIIEIVLRDIDLGVDDNDKV